MSDPIRAAVRVLHRHTSVWTAAITQTGDVRDGAHVAEAAGMVELHDYPPGTRLIVRREPLHPGAQQTFDDVDGHRFTAFVTDQPDDDLATLDARHRAHARVEQRTRDAKDCGMANLPSGDFAINTIWLQLVLAAQDLFAFFAALAVDGDLAVAAPKDGPLPAAARRRPHHHQRTATDPAAGPRLALARRSAHRVPPDPSATAARLTTRPSLTTDTITARRWRHLVALAKPPHRGLPTGHPGGGTALRAEAIMHHPAIAMKNRANAAIGASPRGMGL